MEEVQDQKQQNKKCLYLKKKFIKTRSKRKKKNKKGTDFTIFLKEDEEKNNSVPLDNIPICHSTVDINKLRKEEK